MNFKQRIKYVWDNQPAPIIAAALGDAALIAIVAYWVIG